MNTSRSRVFALAAEEFIQRHKNKELLDAINSAYADVTDEKESTLKSAMRTRPAPQYGSKPMVIKPRRYILD